MLRPQGTGKVSMSDHVPGEIQCPASSCLNLAGFGNGLSVLGEGWDMARHWTGHQVVWVQPCLCHFSL